MVPEHNYIKIPAEIRNDVKIINRSLLDQIAKKPEILYHLSSREFEEAVCELFEKRGYKVKLTKQTRDGGKDIIILNNSLLGDLVFYAKNGTINHVAIYIGGGQVVHASNEKTGIRISSVNYRTPAAIRSFLG